jgi:phenylpropionate dioxygenase-like ring-hydroxylating dioxygenase large terminal subunit
MLLGPRRRNHWYIAARGADLRRRPLARRVLGERLVLFRDAHGRPAALRDRCLHRNMALSGGRVVGGCVECPYHGWRYDGCGRCAAIPSLGEDAAVPAFEPLRAYPAVESDGYVWVYMDKAPPVTAPFRFPHLGDPGWTSFRMLTRFPASAFACLENFLDCPHTVFVHQRLFRTRNARQLRARVRRYADRVEAEFVDEPRARSVVSALFFPSDQPLAHTDRFLMPAISRVDYRFGPDRHFVITSQCTPVSARETVVYTVITFRFGRMGPLVRLVFAPLARWIIRQDVRILARQTRQLQRFGGARFTSVETDLFARHIEALWRRLADTPPDPDSGDGPSARPEVERQVAIRF